MFQLSLKRTAVGGVVIITFITSYLIYQKLEQTACFACFKNNLLNHNEEKEDLSTLRKIHETIWNQIHSLQEIGDCEAKKILICDGDSHYAGLGSMAHRYGVCMQVAFGLGRIFFINAKYYDHFGGLERWILPVSRKCGYLKKEYKKYESVCNLNQSRCYLNNGYDVNNTYKVLEFKPTPRFPYPRHVPGTIPKELEDALVKLGIVDNKMWFSAQFLGYLLLRPNSYFDNFWESLSKQVQFEYPVVSMHIRHGDKLKLEAKYIKEERFLEAAAIYFNSSKINVSTRRIYVASDDKTIERKLKKINFSKNFKIFTLPQNYKRMGLKSYENTNFSATVIESILVDIYFLTYANYTICTYTSNICRLVSMLRQAIPPFDLRKSRIKSLDIKEVFYEYYGYSYEVGKDKFRFSVTRNCDNTSNGIKLLHYEKGELFRVTQQKNTRHVIYATRKHSNKEPLEGYLRNSDVISWPDYPNYFFYPEKKREVS